MKRRLCLLLAITLLLVSGGGCASEPEKRTEDTGTAPDFTVLDGNGNEVQLSDFLGQPVVLNFWATWCYYCKVEMPDFDRAYAEYPEVQFLMVNATDGVEETVESAKKYVADEGYAFDIFFDTAFDAINAYGISGFPTTFFIDANGDVVTYRKGMINYETLVSGIGMITE
ncbi:MAG: TlpA family protein disulfide reductase [Clostridia bacterium]|nr:TlpA family protein disulfide reductase [Clostridia bacterium]